MKRAIIILHEIYGINQFIQDQCRDYENLGFDVFCPNLTDRAIPYSYAEEKQAYEAFMLKHRLDRYKEVEYLIQKLKRDHDTVYLLGFSVGGTIAWRCCENPSCDGIVAVYGSRIRDFLDLNPACPVTLLFANQDSFPVKTVMETLQSKTNVKCYTFAAGHGFMDPYDIKLNEAEREKAGKVIHDFLYVS